MSTPRHRADRRVDSASLAARIGGKRLAVDCPVCGSPSGSLCCTTGSRLSDRPPHHARLAAARTA